MRLNNMNQQIELCDADTAKYFDSKANQWRKEKIDFSKSVKMELHGIRLPVMPKQNLIKYKNRLNREVDQIDIDEIHSYE